jgi:TatD DNase family protein
MHCFNGKKKLVERINKNGWHFSIPTNVVKSEQIQNIIKLTDISKLFTETDAPFLSPYPDKKNEPAFVIESIKKIAEIKGLNLIEVQNSIYQNFQRIFL